MLALIFSAGLGCDAANISAPGLQGQAYSMITIIGYILAGGAAIAIAIAVIRYCFCRREKSAKSSDDLRTIVSSSRVVDASTHSGIERALLSRSDGLIGADRDEAPSPQDGP
jgi:hypothetical protein